MVTEIDRVEVPVEVYVPVPEVYTTPLLYPAPLGETFTVEDLVDRLFTLYDLVDQANLDRGHVATLQASPEG